MRQLEHGFIEGIMRKAFAQESGLAAELLEQVAQVFRNIMVEQELHSEAGAILPSNHVDCFAAPGGR